MQLLREKAGLANSELAVVACGSELSCGEGANGLSMHEHAVVSCRSKSYSRKSCN